MHIFTARVYYSTHTTCQTRDEMRNTSARIASRNRERALTPTRSFHSCTVISLALINLYVCE